jgi:hypothetical protein
MNTANDNKIKESSPSSATAGSAWGVIYSVMSMVVAICGICEISAGDKDGGKFMVLLAYVLSIKADLKKQTTPNVRISQAAKL